MVRALAWRIRGREFESRLNHFPQNQFFFISLSLLFIFLNFEVKQCANMYWKYDNTGFAMEKKPNFFILQKLFVELYLYKGAIVRHGRLGDVGVVSRLIIISPWYTPHKGKTRHIAWLSSFLFKAQCFYRDEDDLAPDDKYYIRGKRNALWFWQHFERTITLAVFSAPAL